NEQGLALLLEFFDGPLAEKLQSDIQHIKEFSVSSAKSRFYSLQFTILNHPNIVEKLKQEEDNYGTIRDFCKHPATLNNKDDGAQEVISRAVAIMGATHSVDELTKIQAEALVPI